MLGKIQTTIDTPELCIAFVKFLKIIVKLGKSITPTYTNIEGKKETHQLVVYQNTLYIYIFHSLHILQVHMMCDN